MADGSHPSLLRQIAHGLGLLAVLALTLATRLADGPVVFADYPTEGAVDFTDGDCYARMTRVKLVLEGKGLVIRRHDFENFPAGTEPHTTAPLDWLIAALALGLCAALPMDAARDMAGAWIGPLLGLGTALFLWRWAGRWSGGRGRSAAMILFAASPILAHGQMIGRPDHQALLILLLAVVLAGELTLLRPRDREAADGSCAAAAILGLAWGMALWVSLWEPLLLWLGATAFGITAGRVRWWTPARKASLIATGAVLLVALGLEGVRISPPGLFDGDRDAFRGWSEWIGELQPVGMFSRVFLSWGTGWCLALPLLLAWAAWQRREPQKAALFALGVLAAAWMLTATQARWGYFFALTAALGTVVAWPESHRLRIAASVAFAAGLWWTAAEMESAWFPRGTPRNRAIEDRISANRASRDAARRISADATRTGLDGSIAARWWDAPALAYRTGRPALTGSSHQAIEGTLMYQFALRAKSARAGAQTLRQIGVRWLLWNDEGSTVPSPPLFPTSGGMLSTGDPSVGYFGDALSPSLAAALEETNDGTGWRLFRLDELAEPPWQPVP